MLLKEIQALHSPLDHFEIIPFLSFTNVEISWIFTSSLLAIASGLILADRADSTLRIIPNSWQIILENTIFSVILFTARENIGASKGAKFVPLIFTGFISILFANLIGLIPYNSAVFSQLVVTSVFALVFFLGVNIIGLKRHGLSLLILVYPVGTSIFLAFLLIPIEIISYFSKSISLAVRLFANITGGHTLLKVIAGFIFFGTSLVEFFPFSEYHIPVILLFFLELAVAYIQAFIFSILVCIYIYDILYLH